MIKQWYEKKIKPYLMFEINMVVASIIGGVIGGSIVLYWILNK